ELMQEYDTVRLAVGQGVGSVVDVVFKHGAGVGRPGAGTFLHVAFRVEGLSALAELADRAVAMGAHTTEIKDRTYFQSVYFREPGGILF
ncbi:VOC family protein, partial [Acinetobacter baumannii]